MAQADTPRPRNLFSDSKPKYCAEAPVEITDESNPVVEEAPVEEKEEAKLEEPVKESLEESVNQEKLNEDKIITSYEIEVEAQESIHKHNAWAYQKCDKK